ncbi:MAG: LytTR family DNA-binding domain-containing protein [Gemmatimonadaceae bacterium]
MRVLIVDDEAMARRRVRRLLTEEADVVVVAECANGTDALEAIRTHDVDVVFLDVQMPGMDGFAVARAIAPEHAPFIVFVTAYSEHALRAFEIHAVDYVVKPVVPDKFRATVAHVRAMLANHEAAESGRQIQKLLVKALQDSPATPAALDNAPRHADRLRIRSGDGVTLVPVADVDWIEADGNQLRVHAGGETHVMRETLQAIESTLDPGLFARVHRSMIVNMTRVREVQPWFGGDAILVMRDGQKVRLSRTYRERVKARFGV